MNVERSDRVTRPKQKRPKPTRVVFLYSGQGAQYYQMGRQLHDADPVYRASIERVEKSYGTIDGRTISEILFSKPLAESDTFDRLIETHPILLAVSIALTDSLRARGVEPDAVLGYSLGETIAAVVCGALGEEEACWAIRAQAGLFERHAPPGRLVAVLAAPEILERDPRWRPSNPNTRAHLAAVNAPEHFVAGLAGADVGRFVAWLEQHGHTYLVLPVRVPFHTPLIEPLRERFLEISGQLSWHPPTYPFHSCAHAGVVASLSSDHFWRVTRDVVRFSDTIEAFAGDADTCLVDVGPSGTLAGFVRMTTGGSADGTLSGGHVQAATVMNQFGQDQKTMDQVVTLIGEDVA
jgi:acyl transferase domain-containing protein